MIWILIIIVAVIISIYICDLEYKTTMYKCASCGKIHKPTPLEWNIAPHSPKKRYLKCPWCGERNWHNRIRLF